MLKCLCRKPELPGWRWFLGVPIIFLLDQVSKWFILENLLFGESRPFLPAFNLTLAHNYGVAFSLFSQRTNMMQIFLISFVLLICVVLAGWLLITPREDKWQGFSLMFILGGALGNLCDRLWHGYVVDFIDFYIGSWHWYTFNLADSFITIGALMMVKTIFFPTEVAREDKL